MIGLCAAASFRSGVFLFLALVKMRDVGIIWATGVII